MGEQKIGAATRKNHEGMPSSPVAVEQSVIVSKILKTRYSEMKSLLGCRTVCFNAGGIYTVSQKKTRHQTLGHNSTNYYAIFKNFSLDDSAVNLQQIHV